MLRLQEDRDHSPRLPQSERNLINIFDLLLAQLGEEVVDGNFGFAQASHANPPVLDKRQWRGFKEMLKEVPF
ncbi:hypothetical protein D3C87_2149640 [compost metagenome]